MLTLLYISTISVTAWLAKREQSGPFFHYLVFCALRTCLLFPLFVSHQQAYSDILWYSDAVYFALLGWAICGRRGLIAGSTVGGLLAGMMIASRLLFEAHRSAAWALALTEISLERYALVGLSLVAALTNTRRGWGFAIDCIFSAMALHNLRPDNPMLIALLAARLIALGMWVSEPTLQREAA